ncbi:MAG: class II aldolase/adducin family protein, partial [bacterium]
MPGSAQLGEKIAAAIEQGNDSVILENHGVVVGGASLSQAFQRFEAFEFAAKTIIKGNQIGKIRTLSAEQLAFTQNRKTACGNFQLGEACGREQELRRQLQLF